MSIHSYIYEDAQETSAACARKVLDLLEQSLADEPTATIAVSGGSTPKVMFEELTKAHFDWSRVHLLWVDERTVPPTDAQSNYRLAKDHSSIRRDFQPATCIAYRRNLRHPWRPRSMPTSFESFLVWGKVKSHRSISSIAAWGRCSHCEFVPGRGAD